MRQQKLCTELAVISHLDISLVCPFQQTLVQKIGLGTKIPLLDPTFDRNLIYCDLVIIVDILNLR